MTAFDYSKPVATAKRLLARFGKRAYLRKAATSGTAYDPTSGTPRDWPITVVELQKTIRNAEGSRVTTEGHMLLVSTEGLDLVAPTDQDTIMIGAGQFPEQMIENKIRNVDPLAPGDTVILYEIELEN